MWNYGRVDFNHGLKVRKEKSETVGRTKNAVKKQPISRRLNKMERGKQTTNIRDVDSSD